MAGLSRWGSSAHQHFPVGSQLMSALHRAQRVCILSDYHAIVTTGAADFQDLSPRRRLDVLLIYFHSERAHDCLNRNDNTTPSLPAEENSFRP